MTVPVDNLPRSRGWLSRPRAGRISWLALLVAAVILPFILGTPFYLHTATVALIYVTLAVAYDIVVGRIGALSLAQPVFYAFGAYSAALIALRFDNPGLWAEAAVAIVGAAVLAIAIGVPAFRLSLHAFAIATLGFALIGQLVAMNWIDVTGGPLCLAAIPAISLPLLGTTWTIDSAVANYFAILAIAVATVGFTLLLARSRLGSAFIAVRDDPVLASARSLWPTKLRLLAFAISAGFTGLAGVFAAHFQHVVCPTQADLSITILLLVMVFIGGRASLRGVVTAALVFTVAPEVLRLAPEWRLVIFGLLLMVTITAVPQGLESLFERVDHRVSRWSSESKEEGR